MKDLKHYMDKSPEKSDKVHEILNKEITWHTNPELFEKLEDAVCKIDKEEAKEIVSKMKNSDGTMGEHWTIEQVEEFARSFGIDFTAFTPHELYVVMNMYYSDARKYLDKIMLGEKIELYLMLALSFLCDEDVKGNKLYNYVHYVSGKGKDY